MTTTLKTPVSSTVGQLSWKGLVTTVVAWLIAFAGAHLTGYDTGKFAEIFAVAVPVYFSLITYLEARFPKFSWFFLLFPQPKAASNKASKK